MQKRKNRKAKEKTSLEKRFTYTNQSGKEIKLTPKQYKFCIAYLENGGVGVEAAIEAGYNVNYPKSKTINRHLARSIATENLSKPVLADFITLNLEKYGFADENVELQHLHVINQHGDLQSKTRAIDMYYRLKNKFPAEKHEHTISFVRHGIWKNQEGEELISPTDSLPANTKSQQ